MSEEKPPIMVTAEVVRDVGGAQTRSPSRTLGAPVHPLAALLLLVVDNLWTLAEWAVIDWVITIPLSFTMVAVPTWIIQKLVRRDPAGRASLLALLLGVIAAIPTSVFGTPVGLALLAWFGIDRLIGRPIQTNQEHR